MYTVNTVPHLRCGECKYFKCNADQKDVESICKRLDHKVVKFSKSPFASYQCGEWNPPCCDFEPKHPDYTDYQEWTSMEEVYPIFVKAWLPYGKEPKYANFVIGNDFDIVFHVPYKLFYFGGMIDGDMLLADKVSRIVKDRIDHGVQLYKVKSEDINGTLIA